MPDCLRFAFLRRNDIEPCGLCPACLAAPYGAEQPAETPVISINVTGGDEQLHDLMKRHIKVSPGGDVTLAPEPEPEPQVDEKEQLRAQAAALGIEVDLRWGVKRLRAEIEERDLADGT